MKELIKPIYDKFDAKRKLVEVQLADEQDLEELKLLEEEIKAKK